MLKFKNRHFSRRIQVKAAQSAMTPRQQVIAFLLDLLDRFDSPLEYSIWQIEARAGSPVAGIYSQVGDSYSKVLSDRGIGREEVLKRRDEALQDAWRFVKLFEVTNGVIDCQLKAYRTQYFALAGLQLQMMGIPSGEERDLSLRFRTRGVPRRTVPRTASRAFDKDGQLDNERQPARTWAHEVRTLIKELYALGIAHEKIAARWFGGHPVLWKETRRALAEQIREAERLYPTSFALELGDPKKMIHSKRGMLHNYDDALAYFRSLLRESLDQIKREADSLASDHLNSLIEATEALLLEENGDSSEVLRLLKQRTETVKTRDPKAGNPDPGGCVQLAQDQAGRVARSRD